MTDTLTVGRTTYHVERGGDDRPPYILTGSRGAIYWLFRTRDDKSLLYVINGRDRLKPTPFRLVREKNPGELEVIK